VFPRKVFETFCFLLQVLQYDLSGFGFIPTALEQVVFGILQITFFSGANGTGSNLGTGPDKARGNALTSNQINSTSPNGPMDFFWDTGTATAADRPRNHYKPLHSQYFQQEAPSYFDDLSLVQVVARTFNFGAGPELPWVFRSNFLRRRIA